MAIQRWMTLVILGVNWFLITVVRFIGSQLPTVIVIHYGDYASAASLRMCMTCRVIF